MYSLIIDIGFDKKFLGLVVNKKLSNYIYFQGDSYKTLIPKIKELMSLSNVKIRDISKIYIPEKIGSLLGLRIAEIFCKSINALLDKKIIIIKYNGLAMSSFSIKERDNKALFLITQFGKDRWKVINLLKGCNIEEMNDHQIRKLPLGTYYISQKKVWEEPPKKFLKYEYNPKDFLEKLFD